MTTWGPETRHQRNDTLNAVFADAIASHGAGKSRNTNKRTVPFLQWERTNQSKTNRNHKQIINDKYLHSHGFRY